MKRIITTLMVLMMFTVVSSQIRGTEINVTVTPDHKDWNYQVGEKCKFVVNVLKSGTLLDNVEVDYEAGPEMYPEVKKAGVTLKDGTMKWTGQMSKPGFYRLKVTAHVGGRDYTGCCTAAYSPEKLTPTTVDPQDFDAFWQKALEEARWTSLQPTRELLPERCTEEVNVYQVSFQNIRWGSRTYGILCIPTKPGKYPALLRVPGAGMRPYEGDKWTAAKGCITLEIGIHGIPVTMTQDYYDKLAQGALNCYWQFNINDRDANYYKRVFVGAVRAIDYIATLPEWNGEKLGVTGSSQGGMLSLVCAALDKRVTCYGAVHAAMCDHTASLQRIACGWPHYFYGKQHVDQKEVEASRYYDGVNFARRITCPGWFSFGYNDDVVPPTTAFATYNTVKAPKELHVYQQTAHFWYQEQWDEWCAWLYKQLGINN
ncbi:MAG: acetylxylan esterase [Prevotella sp.]|nr:acetylxylan esterase [Prevotella sp.]